MTAAKYLWARGNMSWLISNPTVRTDETIAPSGTFKISSTRSLIREEVLKLGQRTRKRQIASLKNIDRHGDSSAIQIAQYTTCSRRVSQPDKHGLIYCKTFFNTRQISQFAHGH
jgi:hypothetical protein